MAPAQCSTLRGVSSRVIARRYTLEVPEADMPGCAVWRARDAVSGGAVVVTLLDDHPQAEATLEALAAVRHPSLPVVLDYGQDGMTRYVVTPRRSGQTARVRLALGGTVPAADAARIGADLADALATLHQHGLVQGRLSLDALVLDETGPPRLEDLAVAGLALPAGRADDDQRALAVCLRDILDIAPTEELLKVPGLSPRLAALLQSLAAANPPDAASTRDALRRIANAGDASTMDAAWEPFPTPIVAPERVAVVPRRRGLKLLVGALVVIVLALAAIAVATVVDRRDASQRAAVTGIPGPVTTVPSTSAETIEGGTTGQPVTPATTPAGANQSPQRIRVAGVTPVDPSGDRQENNATAHFVIDRSRRTGWSTEVYRTRSMGDKGGVGLELRLGVPSRITRLVIRSVPVGATVTIYGVRGPAPLTAPRGWLPLSGAVTLARSQATIHVRHRAPLVTLLIWISDLPATKGVYSVTLREIRVTGIPKGA